MVITGKKVLVLGGWGLVGMAICHKLMEHSPSTLIVTSLKQTEAEDAVDQLIKAYPDVNPEMFVAKWGNIFVREEWKDMFFGDVLADPVRRKGVLSDVYDELNDEILQRSALYKLIIDTKPDIVVECINTATAIAYQDVYTAANVARRRLDSGECDVETMERMMSSVYMPQLIRHVQIFYRALLDAKSAMYLKIGTSGTGGMGLNIPYTHSEERPSRVLLAKAAVAGAQSLLLFLIARTPNGPMVKELKPTAAIAWKRIAYDKVYRRGVPIPLVDTAISNTRSINSDFKFDDYSGVEKTGEDYKSVFIDTGENGIFSKGEFQAISSIGQMEIITPEEIAESAVFEILGGNTGHDIIQGLDSFSMGPTYRGGVLKNSAFQKLCKLEKEHNTSSIAFELLGPPRLSKLLFEAYMIRRIAGSINKFMSISPKEFSDKAKSLIENDARLRSEMLSIGLVILMPDGVNYLRGIDVKIPKFEGNNNIEMSPALLEKWCEEAWVDLRSSNFATWQERFGKIIDNAKKIPDNDTSSRYIYTNDYWNSFEEIDEGKIVGWIFENEDNGWRFKR